MALKKSELYSSLWASLRRTARRHGRLAVQGLRPRPAVREVRLATSTPARRTALLDVPEGGSFADMVALKGDKEIGDKINKIIAKLAEANDLKGVIDVADFNDADKLGKGKEMVDRLSNLVAIFESPRSTSRGNRAEGDDLLGDAYEYLMRHFATESGQEQGPVLHPGRSLAASWRRSSASARAKSADARPSTTRPAAPARCC